MSRAAIDKTRQGWSATEERCWQTDAELLATIEQQDEPEARTLARRAARRLIQAKRAIEAGELKRAEALLDEADRICPMPE